MSENEDCQMSMRWCLLLMLLVLVAPALAIPTNVPPVPGTDDPLPTNNYTLTLNVPGTAGTIRYVNTIVTMTYEHNSPKALNCTLEVNGTIARNATVARSRSETYTLRNGTYVANATCGNSTLTLLSQVIVFTVNNESSPFSGVRIIYPLDKAELKLNVSYTHNASSNAVCTIYIDNAKLNTIPMVVEPGRIAVRNVTLEPADSGVRRFSVNCTNGTWEAGATKSVNITNGTPIDTLDISPKKANPGDVVKIEGVFGSYQSVKITIKNPAGTLEHFNLTTGTGKITFRYNLSLTAREGTYLVGARADDNEVRNGTFTVAKRQPVIMVAGNKTNVTQGKPFLVEGYGFLPDDEITVTLTGGSASTTNKTITDGDGDFDLLYQGTLQPRSYTLTARGKKDSTLSATTTFNIIVAPVDPPVCGDGTKEGTEDCDRGAANGACPATCSTSCQTNDCSIESEEEEDTYVPSPDIDVDDGLDPIDELPRDSIDEQPAQIDGPGSLMWIILPLVLVLLIGGSVGYLAYNGTLDISSFDAFTRSLSGLFGGSAPGHTTAKTGKIDVAEEQTIKSFIYGERGKGFDDLTIRSALLAKGWDKSEVDRVFDELYKEQ